MQLDKKNFIWNIIGTTISSFNSLFFMIIVTRINGVDVAGVFSFGFSLACLFYIIGIYSGRVFQVTDNDKNNDSFSYINNHLISCFVMIVLAIAFCIFRRYTLYKFLIIILLMLFKMLEAFSETLYAIIQIENNLYKVGISLFFKAILGLLFFVLADYFFKSLVLAILFVVIINLVFILLYDFKNTNLHLRDYHFDRFKVRHLFIIGFWPFFFTFLNLYLINLSKYILDFMCDNEIQTIFGILAMPATIVSMFAQFIIHPMLLSIKGYIADRNYKNLIELIKKLSLIILIFGTVCIVGLHFIGIPILNIIYGISLDNYKSMLVIVLIGAVFYSITNVLSNVLTAFRKTISQTVIYLCVSIICTFISYFLINSMYIKGAIYSYLICMVLLFISFVVLTFKVVIVSFKKECC